jgi:hypothetical protein
MISGRVARHNACEICDTALICYLPGASISDLSRIRDEIPHRPDTCGDGKSRTKITKDTMVGSTACLKITAVSTSSEGLESRCLCPNVAKTRTIYLFFEVNVNGGDVG